MDGQATDSSLDSGDAVKVAMSAIIYVVGTFGNLLVIFMILYLGETKKISHWYILQLACADTIFLQSLPFYMTDIIQGHFAHPTWFCKLKETVLYMNYYGSMLFLTIMALDRYIAVCHGLSKMAHRLRSDRNCYLVTLLAWVFAVLLCTPVMMYAGLQSNGEGCKCSLMFPADKQAYCEILNHSESDCHERFSDFVENRTCVRGSEPQVFSDYSEGSYWDSYEEYGSTNSTDEGYSGEFCHFKGLYPGLHIFIYFNFVVMFLLPLTIISVCYGFIVLRLRNTNAKLRRNSERSDSTGQWSNESRKLGKGRRRKSSSSGFSDRDKIRVTAMSAMLVVVFFVCWFPFHSFELAKIPGYTSEIECHVTSSVTLLLIYVNSALNPYLYNFLGTFGKRMREIRKHRRTRDILNSYRWTRARSSNSFKAKKINEGSCHSTQMSVVAMTQCADSNSANENIHHSER